MAPKLHEFTRDRADFDTLSRLTASQEKLLSRALWDLNTAGMPAMTTKAIRAFMGVQAPVLGRHTYINANAGNGGYVAIGNIAHMGMAGSEQDQIVRLGTAAVIAHELGHAIDNGHTPKGQAEQYHTSTSPLFAFNPAGRGKLGGPVLNELIEAYLQSKSSLSKVLWYPFRQVFSRGKWEALVDQRGEAGAIGLIEKEAFAQLFSMYYTLGRTEAGLAELKKVMPRSIQLMEDIHEALEESTTLAQRDQRIRKAFRAAPRVGGQDTGGLVGKSPESIEGRKARPRPGKVQGRKLQAGQRASGDAVAGTGESLTGESNDNIDEMPTRANFTVPDETRVDKAARIFQDKFQRLYKTQRAIREGGSKILMDTDPYAAEERLHGKVKNDLRVLEDDYVQPIADALAEAKIPIEDLDTYVIVKHAPERNDYIATIRDDIPDGGSGFMTAEAVTEQARLEKLHPKISAIADQVYAMLRLKQKLMNRAGLISDELLDAQRAGYQFYVPLKGWAEDAISPNHPRVGQGLSIKGKEFKAALGRKSRAASPTMQSIMDTTEAVIRARKNEVGQYLYKLVEDNPNPEFWEIFEPGKPDMEKRLENGKVVNRPVTMHMSSEYFGVKYEGKQYYIKLKDPLLAQAMQNLGVEQQWALTRMMGTATRFLSSMYTSFSPVFMLTNFERDIQTAVGNVLAETDLHDAKVGGEKIAFKMVKTTPQAIRSMYRILRNKTPQSDLDRAAIDFMTDGAMTGYFDMKDMETQKRHVENLILMAKGGALGKAMKAGKATAQFVEDVNSAVENGVRLSAYYHARQAMEAHGVDTDTARMKASHLAKNLTVNFNRRGELGSGLNATFIFFNASMQGNAQFYRTVGTLKVKPDGSKTLNIAQKGAIGITALAYMWAILNRARSDDDDDGVSFYDKIPSHIKERNIVIMNLDGKTYETFALPYGYNIFHVLGTSLSDVIHGPKKVTDAALELVLTALGSFNPMGISEDKDVGKAALKTLTPTVGKPFAEIALNSNFFGGPVTREDKYNRRTPDSALSFHTTKPHFKAAASWMNAVTGGSQWERGGIDVSPDSLEHVFEFITGGAGTFIDQSAGIAWKLKEGIPVEPRDVPFVSKTYRKPSPYEASRLYYEREDIALAKLDTIKNMEPADRAEFRKQNKEFLKIAGQFEATDKHLSEIRGRRNRLRVKKGISEANRAKQLEDIQKEMNVEYNRMNLLWRTSIEKN